MVATVVASLVFLLSMRQFCLDDWSMEQKWVAVLLPLLLNFDNPLFALTLTSTSLLPAVADAVMQASFLFALLLFWDGRTGIGVKWKRCDFDASDGRML